MSTYCMINRTETGLSEALHELEGLKTEATTLSTQKAQDSEVAALARLQSQIQLAQEMVKAMRKRTESLGSHYRADYTGHLSKAEHTNRYLWAPRARSGAGPIRVRTAAYPYSEYRVGKARIDNRLARRRYGQ